MRGKPAPKRKLKVDPKFESLLLARFINQIMRRGKKSIAQGIVYQALDLVSAKTKQDALEIFDQAIKNCSPILEVKSRRIGGANYQIPIEVRPERQLALAMRWLVNATQERKGLKMSQKLAEEIIAASQNQGAAIKKKEDMHRMADANRAFAHFA